MSVKEKKQKQTKKNHLKKAIQGQIEHVQRKTMRMIIKAVRLKFIKIVCPEYIENSFKLRKGHCNRCGLCCKPDESRMCEHLTFDKNGKSICKIYENRPEACKIYPFDKWELWFRGVPFEKCS